VPCVTSKSEARDFLVLGMTLNCIHIIIVTGRFLYWCVMRPASQRFFIHSCIYLFIISYLATYRGTSSLCVLMCRKAVNQSIAYFHIYYPGHLSKAARLAQRVSYIHTYIYDVSISSSFKDRSSSAWKLLQKHWKPVSRFLRVVSFSSLQDFH